MDLYELDNNGLYELDDKDLFNSFSLLNPLDKSSNKHIVDTSTIELPIFYRGVDSEVGNYTITEVLGVSGFSTLYIAIDNSAEDLVLIKEYFPDFSTLINMRENTFSMPRLPKNTKHPMGVHYYNIEAKHFNAYYDAKTTTIRDFFTQDEAIFTVFEYKQGISLQYYIEQLGTLTEDVIKKLFYPAISSVSLLHEQEILHGRISPDNILLFDNILPVVKYFDQASSETTVESANAFLSPDLKLDQNQLGPWSDIYSLGATLYYCITGQHPPAADARNKSLINENADPYINIENENNSGFHKSLLKAIDWMLNLARRSRPTSIQMIRSVFSPYYNLQDEEFVSPMTQTTSASSNDIKQRTISPTAALPKSESIPVLETPVNAAFTNTETEQSDSIESNSSDNERTEVEPGYDFLDTSIVGRLEDEFSDDAKQQADSIKPDANDMSHIQPDIIQDTVSRHAQFTISQYDLSVLAAQLSSFIGPIATHIIDECYANATNKAMFYRLIERSLDNKEEQAKFRKALEKNNLFFSSIAAYSNDSDRDSASIEILNNPQLIEELKQNLRAHIGPIADILINKSMLQYNSFSEIIDSLAEEITVQQQRDEFRSKFIAYL